MLMLPTTTPGPSRNRRHPPPRKGGGLSGGVIGAVGVAAISRASRLSAISGAPAQKVPEDDVQPIKVTFEEQFGVLLIDEPPEPISADDEETL